MTPAGVVRPFSDDASGRRVVFGQGTVGSLGDELDRQGWRRAFVVATPGRADAIAPIVAALGSRTARMWNRARPHVPVAGVGEAVAAVLRETPGVDVLVAVGGGSPIGLAKAVAIETGLPIVAIPTTYAGSEMTGIWGVTADGVKRTARDPRVQPRLVIYDPELTLDLPPEVSAASGMNAMAHAVEALYAPDATPASSRLAADAIGHLARALPEVVRSPRDLDARTHALAGAHFAGAALGQVAMGLHHKICHVLGGACGLPHALTHAIVLPHVVRFNQEVAREALLPVAAALDAERGEAGDAAAGLGRLNDAIGLPRSLVTIGFDVAAIDDVARVVASGAYANPRPASEDDVRAILAAASRSREVSASG